MRSERRDEPLSSTWQAWPDYDGRYMVGLHFAEIAGRAELVGVEMWSGGPPPSHVREKVRCSPTGRLAVVAPFPPQQSDSQRSGGSPRKPAVRT
jgi:hypothetical protein